jgi:uncharacterized protein YbbK (DUF523 family)/uncharacterized protein YbgA (DUF1722 family)
MSVPHKSGRTQQQNSALRLAVSACLVGQQVRYDGTDKQHRFVTEQLGRQVELIPVCPEVEIGMGVPRPPIHVVERDGELHAIGVANASLDVTRKLNRFGHSMAQQLADIDGYIFKARSPSCGVSSTPVRHRGGWKKGAGLFAARIMHHLPLLPVVEETALDTPQGQLNFIQRVEAYVRWRCFVAQRPTLAQLLEFHHSERLALMAHGADGLRRMERWLELLGGRLKNSDLQAYGEQYAQQFRHLATRSRQLIVLRHIATRCRSSLEKRQRLELKQLIEFYARGDVTREQLLTVLRRLIAGTPLAGQSYLEPGLGLTSGRR